LRQRRAPFARGEKAEALVLDVTDVEPTRRAVAAAEPFQILINNAGMNRPAYLGDVTTEDFDAIFALNVRAAFFMAQTVALSLIERRLSVSFPKISSGQIRVMRQNRRIIRCDACDLPSTLDGCGQLVQIAAAA
jgi:NAD(P)-dependent dehydrogenase (short-subunit alcohol dehydrogenase family)